METSRVQETSAWICMHLTLQNLITNNCSQLALSDHLVHTEQDIWFPSVYWPSPQGKDVPLAHEALTKKNRYPLLSTTGDSADDLN